MQLIAKYTALEECRVAITYFRTLAEKEDSYLLFNRAMSLCLQTEQFWLLNEQSLSFFSSLNTASKDVYNALLLQLKTLCQTNKVFLRGNHLDTVIASLSQQQSLPANALDLVAPFLKESAVDYKKSLQGLRLIHGPDLDTKARATQRLHHSAPHALEIRARTMLLLETLKIVPERESYGAFLKDIISFLIEFHDEEQVNKGDFMSVEEATADRLCTWLNAALRIERPELKHLLSFIANRIIVLGTTMVFSPVSTVDLSELYILIEESAVQAGLEVIDSSNHALHKMCAAAMLMTGICDKSPASLPMIVRAQASDAETATISVLKKYLKSPSLIEQFFATDAFKPYFTGSIACSPIDYQAFFITFAPHLSMRTELSVKAKPELAKALINFIADCRSNRAIFSDSKFMAWYEDEFAKRNMFLVVRELFFTAISNEVNFNRSQLEGLNSAHARLKQYKIIAEDDSSLVDIFVPERDALNLTALDVFYKTLDKEKQKDLIKELVLSVVLQAGAIYIMQADKGYKPAAPAVPIVTAQPSCYSGGFCMFPRAIASVSHSAATLEIDEFKLR
ncbi:hypothetical protein [Legionella sp. km772]|uniref:hypothetical protein n=1 Tax=Legionella sp. km772 TaxID=2498111 RepID=UPI000F8E5C48|nr:hypothetical protein [Legionella sp. km772]RUR08413.1 hypothetical protein ELY15_10930 [Legionella sp. km772]